MIVKKTESTFVVRVEITTLPYSGFVATHVRSGFTACVQRSLHKKLSESSGTSAPFAATRKRGLDIARWLG